MDRSHRYVLQKVVCFFLLLASAVCTNIKTASGVSVGSCSVIRTNCGEFRRLLIQFLQILLNQKPPQNNPPWGFEQCTLGNCSMIERSSIHEHSKKRNFPSTLQQDNLPFEKVNHLACFLQRKMLSRDLL